MVQLLECVLAFALIGLRVAYAEQDLKGQCCAELEAIGFTSNLPVVVIESLQGTEIKFHEEQEVKFCTCSPTDAGWEDYFGYAGAAVRGSSSADFEKKSFKVELHDEEGADIDFELLGMPKEEDFILYGTPCQCSY